MSRFRRRLMGLAAMRKTLADDYVRVEYIENISNAYIDTKIVSTRDDEVTITVSTNDFVSDFLCGARTNDIGMTNSFFIYGQVNENVSFATNNGFTKSSVNIQDGDKHTIQHNKEGGFIDGQKVVSRLFTQKPSNRSYYIFTINDRSTPTSMSKCKLYKFTYSRNNSVIMDLVPVLNKTNGEYGLFDLVGQKFYTSPNGVKFTGGERVIADADDNIYFFRNYIDLLHNSKMCSIGLYPNFPTDGFEAKIYWPKSGRNYVMGAWTNPSSNQFAPYILNSFLYVSYHTANMTPMGNKMPENEILTIKAIPNKLTNKFEVYLNGIFKTSTPLVTTTATNKPFYIGKINGATNGAVRGTKLYSLKYWRNKELVRDYIPVERCSDGVFGLFDKVRNVFQVSEVKPFTGA